MFRHASGEKIVASAAVSIIVTTGSLFLSGCVSEPTETYVRILFQAKRPILEQLVAMSNEDHTLTSVTRIAHDFTRLENNWGWPRPGNEPGISTERWDEYRKLFDAAELPNGLDRAGEASEGVMFSVWGFGIADNSRSKGIAYFPKPPSSFERGSERIIFKPLGDDWYYFEWTTW